MGHKGDIFSLFLSLFLFSYSSFHAMVRADPVVVGCGTA